MRQIFAYLAIAGAVSAISLKELQRTDEDVSSPDFSNDDNIESTKNWTNQDEEEFVEGDFEEEFGEDDFEEDLDPEQADTAADKKGRDFWWLYVIGSKTR